MKEGSKIPRDARAFARRVRMSKATRLWLIVEGRVHDRSFYDRVLGSHPASRDLGYSVRLAEQIELDGVAAGGRKHVTALYELLEKENYLRQQNKQGINRIGFAFDRDFEGLRSQDVVPAQVVMTRGLDVEADILLSGDLVRATSSAYSISRDDVAGFIGGAIDLARALAQLWRDWITAGVCSACTGCETGVRHSKISRINEGGYGAVDPTKMTSVFDGIESRLATDEDRQKYQEAHDLVEEMFAAGEEWLLVKGKWIASYVHHLVTTNLGDAPREKNVAADVVSKTSLETLDFAAPWVNHYHTQLDALHAS